MELDSDPHHAGEEKSSRPPNTKHQRRTRPRNSPTPPPSTAGPVTRSRGGNRTAGYTARTRKDVQSDISKHSSPPPGSAKGSEIQGNFGTGATEQSWASSGSTSSSAKIVSSPLVAYIPSFSPPMLWARVKPNRSLWGCIRLLFIVAVLAGFIRNIPKVYTPKGLSWNTVTIMDTFRNIGLFTRLCSNPSVESASMQYKSLIKQCFLDIERLKDSAIQLDSVLAPGQDTNIEDTVIRLMEEHLNALRLSRIVGKRDEFVRREANSVNFFAVGNGAVINSLKSSPTYKPHASSRFRSWLGYGKAVAPPPHNTVLRPWDDSGDGWCGAATVDRQGRPNGVVLNLQLGRSITPEHIVVEHILPAATLEPDARPREIELWAHVDGVELQQRLLDFATSHFHTRSSEGVVPPVVVPKCDGSECFYLVGRFEYESNPLHGGVFTHKLSDELGLLGVKTENVRVVAKTNFGDESKTCFYRLRLYGKVADNI